MSKISITNRALRKAGRIFISLHYRYCFGHDGALAAWSGRVASSLERKVGMPDVPFSAAVWDEQYAIGRWDFLASREEAARFSIIAGYLQMIKPGGSVLDVGCGTGVLYRRVRPYGYSRYLGIDISEVAVRAVGEFHDDRTQFLATNAETFQPPGKYDAIVFNEVLCCLNDSVQVVDNYSRFLEPNGVMIVSTYCGSARETSLLRVLKRRWKLLDETQVTHGQKSWLLTVLARTQMLAFWVNCLGLCEAESIAGFACFTA